MPLLLLVKEAAASRGVQVAPFGAASESSLCRLDSQVNVGFVSLSDVSNLLVRRRVYCWKCFSALGVHKLVVNEKLLAEG